MPIIGQLPRFRQARRSLAVLAARESWSRAEIEEFQLARINSLWSHSRLSIPYYREIASARKLPPRFDSLGEFQSLVPVLEKTAIRKTPEAFICTPLPRGKWYCTGGSTGAPLSIFWGADDYRETLRAKYRFYSSWGIDLFDRTVFLWGGDHRFATGVTGRLQRLREHIYDRLRNRLRLSAYHLHTDELRNYLRRITSFQPTMLYGFSRAVFLLAREAIPTNFLCNSLKLVVVTSETVSNGMMQMIENGLKAPLAVEYGAAECPLIAGQSPDGTLHIREDLALIETLPRDDGRFDLVLTVLGNRTFPLFRYSIEDIVDQPLQKPETGFAILSYVSGRNDDLLVSGTGDLVHATLVDAVFENEPAIRRYHVSSES